MKRVFRFVTACVVASCVAAPAGAAGAAVKAVAKKPATPPPAAKMVAARFAALKMLAPADEYFGPLKMSILGVKNTIHDAGLRYDVNHDIAKTIVPGLRLTEAAIRDWEHKYPHDRDVPRAMYFLQRLYAHVIDETCRQKASDTAKWLFADYPASPQAKLLHKQLAIEAAAPPASAPGAAPAVQPAIVPASTPARQTPPSGQQLTPSGEAAPAVQPAVAPANPPQNPGTPATSTGAKH